MWALGKTMYRMPGHPVALYFQDTLNNKLTKYMQVQTSKHNIISNSSFSYHPMSISSVSSSFQQRKTSFVSVSGAFSKLSSMKQFRTDLGNPVETSLTMKLEQLIKFSKAPPADLHNHVDIQFLTLAPSKAVTVEASFFKRRHKHKL